MRKKGNILVKIFFGEHTIYIWKYFVLNIRADSSYLLKLACSPTSTVICLKDFWILFTFNRSSYFRFSNRRDVSRG